LLPKVDRGPKWDPNADCDGEKASEKTRRLGEVVASIEKKRLSPKQLQERVMQDFPKSFRDGTETQRLRGGWVAAGLFCRAAAFANLGFCSKPSKPCDELKFDCEGGTGPACQEHTDKCEFLSPSQVASRLGDMYENMKRDNSGTCSHFFDVMYTKVAMEQWFDQDARLVFTKGLGGVEVDVKSGLALWMFDVYDSRKKNIEKNTFDITKLPGFKEDLQKNIEKVHTPIPPDRQGWFAFQSDASHRREDASNAFIAVALFGMILFCGICICSIWHSFFWSVGSEDEDEWSHRGSLASAYTPEYLDFQCPPGNEAGDLVEVNLPDGTLMQVTVPPGVYGGMNFSVQV